MTLVLDTAVLGPTQRAEALHAAMLAAGVPADARPHDDGHLHARIEVWPLGNDGTTVMRRRSTGIRLTRSARHVRSAAPERFALTLVSAGAWSFAQGRTERCSRSREGELLLVDHAAPYEFRRPDVGTTIAVNCDRDLLELPMDVIVAAGRRLVPANPLHRTLSEHLGMLARQGAPPPVRTGTTIALVRALVATAGGDETRARAAWHDSLPARLSHYVQANLTDPELSPARIARVHHISLRHLYVAWSAGGPVGASSERSASGSTLARSIIGARLALARELLERPGARGTAIAEVGRACGFRDTTHFTHRFRDAYGASPRAWRGGERP